MFYIMEGWVIDITEDGKRGSQHGIYHRDLTSVLVSIIWFILVVGLFIIWFDGFIFKLDFWEGCGHYVGIRHFSCAVLVWLKCSVLIDFDCIWFASCHVLVRVHLSSDYSVSLWFIVYNDHYRRFSRGLSLICVRLTLKLDFYCVFSLYSNHYKYSSKRWELFTSLDWFGLMQYVSLQLKELVSFDWITILAFISRNFQSFTTRKWVTTRLLLYVYFTLYIYYYKLLL